MLAVEAATGKPAPGRRIAAKRVKAAARSRTAGERAGGVVSAGVGVFAPVVCVVVGFLLLGAGPAGWLLLVGLIWAVSSSDSGSRRSRSSSKVTGFYSPYAPKR